MSFGSSDRGFSRQDFFKPTAVKFEEEGGMDEGGLTQEMHRLFWQGVIQPEVGLFELADAALPRADASEERLELVGMFLCKSVITEKRTGRGLAPFVFEFLIDETERSFDPSLPIDEQARAALRALKAYDQQLFEQFNDILVGFVNDGDVPNAYLVEELAPTHPHAEQAVTKDNVREVIVAACKYRLWDAREAQLLALRRGFSTASVLSKEPIDLLIQLQPFETRDLLLLVQGETRELTNTELVEQCIQWPNEAFAATSDNGGGFPPGSVTVALLRELLADQADFNSERRMKFLRWATALPALPDAGLAGTDGGKIRFMCDRIAQAGDEAGWPLPYVSTCFHVIHMPNYSDPTVLKQKLFTAMESWHFDDVEH
mmetsp:Transcript_64404/g.107030  ORF Transcript_64404/g.107030 Transcript_64404/m.107030 type:complete len:373 (+) Transcript_64404:236-1354(+)